METKQQYRNLCEVEPSVPLFHQAWWLDAVCGEDGWSVATYIRDGKITAALPYIMKKKFGLKQIGQPRFTQTLGVWFAPSKAKYTKRIGKEKEVVFSLIDSLPYHHIFFQGFHHNYDNWLPFYFRGFEQTTKYSYVIKDLSDLDSIWGDMSVDVRRDVRRSKDALKVVNDISASEFYKIVHKTYSRQGMSPPYSEARFIKLAEAVFTHGSGKMFAAVDSEANIHAVSFIVWDKHCAYYLIGGGDPEFRNSGAATLCIWEAIKFSSTVTNSFDFEGSMVENIERYFRGFGGNLQPYYRIYRFQNVLIGLAFYFRRYFTKRL